VNSKSPALPEEEINRIDQCVPFEARLAGQRAHRAALERFGRVVTVKDGQLGTLSDTGEFSPSRSLPRDTPVSPGVRVKLNKTRR